ncbi:MAG: DUF5919 domain-containing protein [Candidatus Rokuibacteriota bacterium]
MTGADRVVHRIVGFVTHKDADLLTLSGCSLLLFVYDLWEQNWTFALFAATLAAFAFSMIRLRRDVGALNANRSGLPSIFMDRTPTDVIDSIKVARDLFLVGVSLDRTLRNAYTPLEGFLTNGGRLRVLVVDPRSDSSIRIADRRAYQEHGLEQRRNHILASITAFRDLRRRTRGALEIRVIDDPLAFGATMIDGDDLTAATRIVVQHYSFKKRAASEPNPVFIVRPSDQQWFLDFKEELDNPWQSATAWPAE